MRDELYVRELTPEERGRLERGLRSRDGFLLRRCQVLLASGRRERVGAIAEGVGCCRQTVRNVIHGFNRQGLASLGRGSHRPGSAKPELDEGKPGRLKEMLHQSPRTFGKPTGLWTLQLAAEVAHERGLTAAAVSYETVRRALKAMGTNWRRAKHWITSPDPQYARKKSSATA